MMNVTTHGVPGNVQTLASLGNAAIRLWMINAHKALGMDRSLSTSPSRMMATIWGFGAAARVPRVQPSAAKLAVRARGCVSRGTPGRVGYGILLDIMRLASHRPKSLARRALWGIGRAGAGARREERGVAAAQQDAADRLVQSLAPNLRRCSGQARIRGRTGMGRLAGQLALAETLGKEVCGARAAKRPPPSPGIVSSSAFLTFALRIESSVVAAFGLRSM